MLCNGMSGFNVGLVGLCLLAAFASRADEACAGGIDDYELMGTVSLPGGGGPFDVLSDGRIVSLGGSDLYVESAVGTGTFDFFGAVPGADFSSFGAGFLEVSPGGDRIAIGNGGGESFSNFEVGVFDANNLSGSWFGVGHFAATWYDDTQLALTAATFGNPGVVTMLDTTSDPLNPTNPVVVDGVGGASGGIAFDDAGGLYTGNGFSITGPSGTGAVMQFPQASWLPALSGGEAVDFESDGNFIIDILSASSLGFDGSGNLHVGGGDFGVDGDYAAIIDALAVAAAREGQGPVSARDGSVVRRFDPDPSANTFYSVNFNDVTGDLYLQSGSTVYRYAVPEPMTAALLLVGAAVLLRKRRSSRKGGYVVG